ncbi:MAG: homoserine kinase [Actinobacteria bacterium HGW-Actinobacteria-7]|jgi:homoserine kinase|nr:MAG: homoserine kinase [Actinobacteria bacterium HGW-Actinobacteria-7]
MGAAVLVPATSANLGPGFDSFGLALDLHNRFEAELAPEWRVVVSGAGAGALATDGTNLAAVAMARAFAEAGHPELRAEIGCVNQVPTGSGLGSSSTAIIAGLLLGQALVGVDFGEQRVLELATEIEGHPDNVAAALVGGFTVCWTDVGGPRFARFEPARGLAAVVVPAIAELATRVARAMLPDAVPHEDAAFNVAHAGLLAASIAVGRPELLGAALADRLHEPYRAAAVADLREVHDILRDSGAAGVALSGAGPTVIGLVAGDTDELAHALAQQVADRAAERIRALGTRRAPQALRVDRTGARLL